MSRYIVDQIFAKEESIRYHPRMSKKKDEQPSTHWKAILLSIGGTVLAIGVLIGAAFALAPRTIKLDTIADELLMNDIAFFGRAYDEAGWNQIVMMAQRGWRTDLPAFADLESGDAYEAALYKEEGSGAVLEWIVSTQKTDQSSIRNMDGPITLSPIEPQSSKTVIAQSQLWKAYANMMNDRAFVLMEPITGLSLSFIEQTLVSMAGSPIGVAWNANSAAYLIDGMMIDNDSYPELSDNTVASVAMSYPDRTINAWKAAAQDIDEQTYAGIEGIILYEMSQRIGSGSMNGFLMNPISIDITESGTGAVAFVLQGNADADPFTLIDLYKPYASNATIRTTELLEGQSRTDVIAQPLQESGGTTNGYETRSIEKDDGSGLFIAKKADAFIISNNKESFDTAIHRNKARSTAISAGAMHVSWLKQMRDSYFSFLTIENPLLLWPLMNHERIEWTADMQNGTLVIDTSF